MANINTKRRNKANNTKRGYALKTGFGEEHGSKKRKSAKDYSKIKKS